jgi:hypothetical protein
MNTKRIIFGLFIAALSFTSCSDDEGVDFQPNPLFLSTENSSVDETDESIDVMVNITESRTTDLIITYAIGGTAVDGVDYTSNNESTVTIPANSLNAEINLSLIDNDIINELRDVTFRITEVSDSSLTVNNSETITVSIIDDESYKYRDGILVINQGGFLAGDASVSFLSDDLTFTENNIFSTTNNNSMLGDTGQSIAFNDNLAYIVLNGSNKIEVVNRYSFASVATIDTGLANPRYMAFANGKGYLTNWGDANDPNDDYVAIIDLNSNTITSTIAVVEGPEQIINVNGSLYITNKGGYNTGNIITKIDSNNTVTTINTGDSPDEIVLDNNNNLWVLCEGAGYPNYDTYGSLIKINTNNDTISKTIDFGKNIYESSIVYENGSIYFYYGSEIYKMNEDDTNLPANPIITQNLDYGSMAIKNNILYGTLPNYTDGVSDIYIYDLDTNSLQNTFELGNGGFNIYFN